MVLATLAAVLLATGTAAAAELTGVYRFDDTLSPGWGAPPLTAIGPGSYADGNGSRVYELANGSGLELDTTAFETPRDFQLRFIARFDRVTGADVRVLDWSGGASDDGLYVRDGHFVLVRDGSVVQTSVMAIAAGEWVDLRLSRSSHLEWVNFTATNYSYEDYEARFAIGDSLRWFADDDGETSAAAIDALWVFEGHPRGDDYVGDTTPPEASLLYPEPQAGTLYAAGRPFFALTTSEYVHVNPGQVTVVEGADGDEVAAWETELGELGPSNGEFFAAAWPDEAPTLEHGAAYTLRVRFVDYNGNEGEDEFPFVADAVAPTGLSLDATPSETADRPPLVAGRADVGEGDEDWVLINVYRGGAATGRPQDIAETWGLILEEDGSFAAPTITPLNLGLHTIEAVHSDYAGNSQRAVKTIRIVAGPPPAEPRPPDVLAPPPFLPPSPPPFSAPTASARDVAGSLAVAWAARLRALRLRGVLRGARLAFVSPVAGTAVVRVYTAGRRRALVAQGRLSFDDGDRGTIALRPTAAGRRALRGRRRATLVLRTAFAAVGGAPVIDERRLTLRR